MTKTLKKTLGIMAGAFLALTMTLPAMTNTFAVSATNETAEASTVWTDDVYQMQESGEIETGYYSGVAVLDNANWWRPMTFTDGAFLPKNAVAFPTTEAEAITLNLSNYYIYAVVNEDNGNEYSFKLNRVENSPVVDFYKSEGKAPALYAPLSIYDGEMPAENAENELKECFTYPASGFVARFHYSSETSEQLYSSGSDTLYYAPISAGVPVTYEANWWIDGKFEKADELPASAQAFPTLEAGALSIDLTIYYLYIVVNESNYNNYTFLLGRGTGSSLLHFEKLTNAHPDFNLKEYNAEGNSESTLRYVGDIEATSAASNGVPTFTYPAYGYIAKITIEESGHAYYNSGTDTVYYALRSVVDGTEPETPDDGTNNPVGDWINGAANDINNWLTDNTGITIGASGVFVVAIIIIAICLTKRKH